MALASLVLALAALLALDLRGMDPATLKLPVVTTGLGLLLLLSAARRRPAPDRPADAAVLAWLAWSLVAGGLAPYPARATLGLALTWIPVGAYWLARRELGARQVAVGLGVLAAAAAATQAVELLAPPPWAQGPMGRPANELVGAMANPNRTATLVLLGAPAFLASGGAPALLLVAVALVGSLSRGAWIGALVAAAGAAWSGRRPPLGGVALAMVVAGVVLASGRLHPGQVLRSRTVQSRLDLGRLFTAAAAERPHTGWGPRAGGVAYGVTQRERGRPQTLSDREDFAHNPLLQQLVELGWPGLTLALLAVGLALRDAWRRAGAARTLCLGLLAAGVAELVSVGLEGPLLRALAAGTLAAAMGPAQGSDARSPVALLLGLGLLASTPHAVGLVEAEVARRQARGLGADGASHVLPLEVADRLASPEVRADSAGQLALSRRLALARARYLVLEARSPGYGSSEDTRASIREYLRPRAPRRAGPAPPPPP